MFRYLLAFAACVGLLLTVAGNFNTDYETVSGLILSWTAIMVLGLFYSKFLFSMTVTMDMNFFIKVDKLKKEIIKSKESKDSYLTKLAKASDMLEPRSKLEKLLISIALIFNPKTISFYRRINADADDNKYFKCKDTQFIFILKIAPAFILITSSMSLIVFLQGVS